MTRFAARRACSWPSGARAVVATLLARALDDSRTALFPIIFSVWALVSIHAVAHDPSIVRIAPEPFTVHPPAWYPGQATVPLLATRSMPITCHLVSGPGSLVLLCSIPFLRSGWKRRESNRSMDPHVSHRTNEE